jgi:hypothetical protein
MDFPLRVQGRNIRQEDLQYLKAQLASGTDWSRWSFSRSHCEQWNWRAANGQLKDMACRTLLLKLEQRGLLELPKPRYRPKPSVITPSRVSTEPITGSLTVLQPLRITPLVPRTSDYRLAHQLLREHHYLGFRTPVGETIGYLVRDGHDRMLAIILFGAAAWKTAARDEFIGWDARQREDGLSRIVNNQRFLILPWVKVPHLASHLLGLIARRVAADWQAKYHHPIVLLETFVETARFKGTCYQAANWINVGETTGRSRQDRYTKLKVPIKAVYLYPLRKKFRQQLCR